MWKVPGVTLGTPGVILGIPGVTLGTLEVTFGTRGGHFGHQGVTLAIWGVIGNCGHPRVRPSGRPWASNRALRLKGTLA